LFFFCLLYFLLFFFCLLYCFLFFFCLLYCLLFFFFDYCIVCCFSFDYCIVWCFSLDYCIVCCFSFDYCIVCCFSLDIVLFVVFLLTIVLFVVWSTTSDYSLWYLSNISSIQSLPTWLIVIKFGLNIVFKQQRNKMYGQLIQNKSCIKFIFDNNNKRNSKFSFYTTIMILNYNTIII
jgi:hypothetical protein